MHCRNAFATNETNTICRAEVLKCLKRYGRLQIVWGAKRPGDGGANLFEARDDYVEKIFGLMAPIIDSLICFGFVCWTTRMVRSTTTGRLVAVPSVVDPTTGICMARGNVDATVSVTFYTTASANEQEGYVLPVYVWREFAPTWDGLLKSPMRGLLNRLRGLERRRNFDACALKTRSRPPIVIQNPNDPFASGRIDRDTMSDLVPGVKHPGRLNPYDGERTAFGVPADPTGMAKRVLYNTDLMGVVRQRLVGQFGTALARDGSGLFVSDPFTGAEPDQANQQGPFAENEHPIVEGHVLVQQVMPMRDEGLEKESEKMEKYIAAMWGVPLVFVNLEEAQYKQDVSELRRVLIDGVASLGRYACEAIEHMLNQMFRVEETKELKARGLVKALLGAKPESKHLEDIAVLVPEDNRYHVSLVMDQVMTMEEVVHLVGIGLKLDVARDEISKTYPLPQGALVTPEMPGPAPKDGTTETPAKDGSGKRKDTKTKRSKRKRKESDVDEESDEKTQKVRQKGERKSAKTDGESDGHRRSKKRRKDESDGTTSEEGTSTPKKRRKKK